MNYTPNYHLPQWDETDRVLMADFNQMCRDMDGGLTRMDRVGLEKAKDAYRSAALAAAGAGHGAAMDSMWINPLACPQETGPGVGWAGKFLKAGLILGGPRATEEHISATAKEESYLSTIPAHEYQNRDASVTFSSNGCGLMETVALWASRASNFGTDAQFPYTITLTDADSGEVLATAGPYLMEYRSCVMVPVNFPLETGMNYRMTFKIPDGFNTFAGRGGFLMASSIQNVGTNHIAVVTYPEVPNPLTRTVTAPDYAAGAVGMLHWRGDGAASLTINGQPLPVLRTSETTDALGIPHYEIQYTVDPLPDGPFPLELHMEKGEGTMITEDYGLIWF